MQEYRWNDKFMSLDVLLQTEEETTSRTLNSCGKESIEFNNLINIFFRLSYHCKEQVAPDSDEHYFITLADFAYIRLPYSLRAICDLWVKGYYLEAMIVYRQILEGLAFLRYFHNHKDSIKTHLGVTTPRKRVRFYTMFEEIAPGFYGKYYGKIFSDITHGGVVANLFRAEYSSPTKGRIVMGCEFSLKGSALVTRTTILVSYGYLNYISVFFPSITSKTNSTMNNRIKNILEHIENKYLKQCDDEFIKAILPLIRK